MAKCSIVISRPCREQNAYLRVSLTDSVRIAGGISFDYIKLYLNKNTVNVFCLLKLSINKINLNIFHDYFIIKTFIFDYLFTFKRCFPLMCTELKMWIRFGLLYGTQNGWTVGWLLNSNLPCIFNQVKRYSKFISLHLLYISEF